VQICQGAEHELLTSSMATGRQQEGKRGANMLLTRARTHEARGQRQTPLLEALHDTPWGSARFAHFLCDFHKFFHYARV
ncbi:MAG: hypothetical protein NTZ54_03890, partial [Alphaproteobacteria bacterium]|nr:hypothetical protein [Alphaproteobacteria bacterium]